MTQHDRPVTPATAGTHVTSTGSDDPDAIRRDIERTRGRLSDDVDTLGETVSPANVAHRATVRAKGRVSSVKDSIMGSAHDVQSSGGNAVHAVSDGASDLPRQARSQTRGNPLAAGAIALGVGWLVGSLMPASAPERELSASAREKAQPLVEEAKGVAQDIAQDLKQPASEAVQSVKEQASSGAQQVKDEGQSRAQDVRSSTQDDAG